LPSVVWFQTAWRFPHVTRRQAPSSTSVGPIPLGGTTPSARCHPIPMATATVLGLYHLVARPSSPGAIPVAQVLLVFGTSG